MITPNVREDFKAARNLYKLIEKNPALRWLDYRYNPTPDGSENAEKPVAQYTAIRRKLFAYESVLLITNWHIEAVMFFCLWQCSLPHSKFKTFLFVIGFCFSLGIVIYFWKLRKVLIAAWLNSRWTMRRFHADVILLAQHESEILSLSASGDEISKALPPSHIRREADKKLLNLAYQIKRTEAITSYAGLTSASDKEYLKHKFERYKRHGIYSHDADIGCFYRQAKEIVDKEVAERDTAESLKLKKAAEAMEAAHAKRNNLEM